MDIITGKTGAPHVTSQQDREINQAIFGDGNVVLNVGSCFKAELQENNVVRIYDGLLMLQGTGASIANGNYEDVTIENGSQYGGRIDLICAKYEKAMPEGIESVKLVVMKGVTATVPTPPMISTSKGNIRKGDLTAFFPLYKVTLNGVAIEGIEPVFDFAKECKVLWSGNEHMSANHRAELLEPVSRQNTGICLVYVPYTNGQARDYTIKHQFIHKNTVAMHPHGTYTTMMCNSDFSIIANKIVYVDDDVITGYAGNEQSGTTNGIKYSNGYFVLRYVLGY